MVLGLLMSSGGPGLLAAFYAGQQRQRGDVQNPAGSVQLSGQLHRYEEVRLRPTAGSDLT